MLITSSYIRSNVPIDIEEFEEGDATTLRAGGQTNAETILSFLAANSDKAYTPKEIHEATEIPRGSVGVVLSRLNERGFVRHRGEYWALADTEDVEKTLNAMVTARAVTDRFGPEDPEEWGPGVESEEE